MTTNDLISKLIELQDRANAHIAEYTRLRTVPGRKSEAASHNRKAARLQSKIQKLIREIALRGSKPS